MKKMIFILVMLCLAVTPAFAVTTYLTEDAYCDCVFCDCGYSVGPNDVLDCQGHAINAGTCLTCDDTYNSIFTYVDENSTVKNCIIKNFYVAIYNVAGSGTLHLFNNTFINNTLEVYLPVAPFYIDFNNSETGNYWDSKRMNSIDNTFRNITDSGYSNNCTNADNDNFCDEPYDVYGDASWYDYHPLTNLPVPPSQLVTTLTDVGTGLGNFISNIQDPVVNFVLVLGLIGGVLSIFMAIAYVIKGALLK